MCKIDFSARTFASPSTFENLNFRFLIENEVKFEKFDQGKEPIHVAAENGHFQVFQLLLENVKDKNPLDRQGRVPLHYAASKGHLNIVKILDGNPGDKQSKTPLHLASEAGHFEVFRQIYHKVSNKNPSDANGLTPFDLAVENNHFEICKLMVQNCDQIDKNPKFQKTGKTLLHWAAENGDFQLCQFLLRHLRNFNLMDDNGKTPFDLAADNAHWKVCQVIIGLMDKSIFRVAPIFQIPLSGAERAKRAEPHLTPRLSYAIGGKLSKWTRAKRAIEI